MTTRTNGGDKEAAPTTPQEVIHLISDHDNIGEPKTWCGAESFSVSESLAEVTCTICLKAAKIYGEGAATRLQQLTPKRQSEAAQTLTLQELQQIAVNGDKFIVITGRGNEHKCEWIDVKRGSFRIEGSKFTCAVDGAPNAKVRLAK